ncbi:protein cer1-like 1 [Quercus suber]|uniref:Protein cer1-like 1 n=1 Tax=Quercus suber TaxID=58331 RepID=A0AAW0IM62_QUESU
MKWAKNKVATLHEVEYMKLNKALDKKSVSSLILSKTYAQKIWLVGDGLTEEEQLKVRKETLFIPYSQSPPKKYQLVAKKGDECMAYSWDSACIRRME